MRRILILILILIFQFAILFSEAKQNSATTDENVHLPVGYTYLKFHDFRFNPEHPNFQKVWIALPLLFQKINLPTDFDDLWQRAGNFEQDTWREARDFGEKLLYSSGNDADKILLSGRLMTIILTLSITVAVFLWSKKLWGGFWAGIVAAILFAFEPLILAHGNLTNTDISVSLFFALSVWFLIKFFQNSSWKNTILLGVALGLLQLSKYTAIIFYPFALAALIYWLWVKHSDWKKEFKKVWLKIIVVLAIHWVVITLAYFPHIKMFYSPDYIKGLILVVKHAAGGHSSFLLGQFSNQGWWYYFPFAFLVKTSLITLILLAGMKILYLKKQLKFNFEQVVILIAIAIYFLSAISSKANLGARHLLPIYPLIFVLLGFWGTGLSLKLKVKSEKLQLKIKNFIILLLILFVLDSLAVFPHHLAYFNQLIGTENGYKYLLDSNYDWGQELKRIAVYQRDVLFGEKVYLDYWWDGDLAPDYYGINYERMTPEKKYISGMVVIGATSYMMPEYRWLREYPILDRIGNGVFVIDLRQKI
ncbi:MAG: Glycosyl transferase family protein [Candidatus Berkelbacteria bacterium Licking1014_7]|uniref:Glycosyl transferase family protein n=1 Tax=Candidatus Berkelbacteria bacterium Licking1014_7 TaxID=2017147 RepID=A0A554LHU2_9BACT|nr:MAG: Glycosyl transferase family protein [Candidatus Berkelbacteria bacterium Licking1014_7]